jgi:diacylglycerol kinase
MIKKHTISLRNAFHGLFWVLKTQPNYQIHFTLSLVAIVGAVLFRITYAEFLIILILIIAGLTVESINSGIEATTDAIDKKWRQDIGLAKDISAAAMLIIAIGSLVISGIIFIPRIISLF